MYSIWIRHRFVADICTCTGAYCTLGTLILDAFPLLICWRFLLLPYRPCLWVPTARVQVLVPRLTGSEITATGNQVIHLATAALIGRHQPAKSVGFEVCLHNINRNHSSLLFVPNPAVERRLGSGFVSLLSFILALAHFYVRRLAMETHAHPLAQFKPLLFLLLSGLPTGFFFSWLWQAWLLPALVISCLLLLGGGLLLSAKQPVVHAISVGVTAGAFVGSLIGISSLLSG